MIPGLGWAATYNEWAATYNWWAATATATAIIIPLQVILGQSLPGLWQASLLDFSHIFPEIN